MFSVCYHPEILLPWQCDVTTFPLYKTFYSTASNSVVRKCCDLGLFPMRDVSSQVLSFWLTCFYSQPIENNSVHTVWPNHSKNHGFPTPTGEVSKSLLPILQVLTIPPATQMKFTEEEIFILPSEKKKCWKICLCVWCASQWDNWSHLQWNQWDVCIPHHVY